MIAIGSLVIIFLLKHSKERKAMTTVVIRGMCKEINVLFGPTAEAI